MARKWTRGERKEYLKEKYRKKKEKFFAMVAVAVFFLALLSLLAWGISTGADPFLLVVLLIIILIMIPVSIFLMDTVTHEM